MPEELSVGVGLEMHADAEAEVSAMGQLQEGHSDKDPTEALLHRSMCEFDEICRAQHLLMNMQCFDLAGTSGDEAKQLDIDGLNNTALVSALMYGVAIGGLFTTPTPSADTSQQHMGYLLGSQSTNGTLWCLAVVFLLFATLIAIFALNMLKQVEDGTYGLFTEVLWRPLLQLPYLLCFLGIFTQMLAFLSYLTIHWGEHRTLCCALACAPAIALVSQIAQSRMVFATDVVVEVQKALSTRTHVTLSPAQIAAALDRYVAERSQVLLREDFVDFLTPPRVALDLAQGAADHVRRRAALLPRPTLSPCTIQLAEKLFDRLVEEHIAAIVDAVDISDAQETLRHHLAGGAD